MATRKAAKKSTKKSTKKYPAKKKPTKKPTPKPRPKPRPKSPLVPGNDPIIVGGGSVFLDFDTRFGGITAPPGKRKFQDPSVNLTQVVVVNSAGTVIHRIPLNRTDKVVICYSGSACP